MFNYTAYFLLYRCRGLILLETYTSNRADDFELPPFLDVQQEVTGDLDYSMYNLSKKLDPPPSITSTPDDNPTRDGPDAADSTMLELDTKAYGCMKSMDPTLVCDRSVDQPEILAKEKSASELSPRDVDSELLMSDALVHDSMEVRTPEMDVESVSSSEPSAKVVVGGTPGGTRNGYRCDFDRDQVANLTLGKLDAAHGSAVLNGTLSGNGHIIQVDEYERFAKLCLGGKSGAPAVK